MVISMALAFLCGWAIKKLFRIHSLRRAAVRDMGLEMEEVTARYAQFMRYEQQLTSDEDDDDDEMIVVFERHPSRTR